MKSVSDLAKWMGSPRFAHIKRSYTAKDVWQLRPAIPTQYPSATLSSGLYECLRGHQSRGTATRTFGCLDPVQLTQMLPEFETIYVSGWQCSSTAASNMEVGPDFADYPYDTVPNKVRQLYKAMEFHVTKARLAGQVLPMRYLIGDGDTGHGGVTSTMKMTKMFLESGSAGVHLEDQRTGAKKCGHLGGKVLVSVGEQVTRLMSARLQADLMGAGLVLIARTDAESAEYIDSDVDPRDREFIVDSGRTEEGYYRVRSGLDYSVARACHFAPYADLIWFETSRPDLDQAREFARRVKAKCPGTMLAYNLSPSFNWLKSGLTEAQIFDFIEQLGRYGYCWQFMTLAGLHLNGLASFRFCRDYRSLGVLGYVKGIQRQEEALGVSTWKHQTWSGVDVSDRYLSLISKSSILANSARSTEKQF